MLAGLARHFAVEFAKLLPETILLAGRNMRLTCARTLAFETRPAFLVGAAMCSFVLVLFASTPTVVAQSHRSQTEQISKLADRFHYAMQNGEVESVAQLATPNATLFSESGGESSNLVKALSAQVKKRRKQPLSSTRVISREIVLLDTSAITIEILAAGTDVQNSQKVAPLRRSITWIPVPPSIAAFDVAGNQWRVVHVHVSHYSRWEDAIKAFEKSDEQVKPEAGGIVFVGSSSIRGWKTLQQDFPDANAIGRGFGGSQLIDSIAYAHRIISPYKPRAVAVYAGDNDMNTGKSAKRVVQDFKMLVKTIHAKSPQAKIGFIAIKPSISRWALWPKMKQANDAIAEFANGEELVTFLDIATPMLGADGKPISELFVKDGLHLTPAGYQLWTNVVKSWVNQP